MEKSNKSDIEKLKLGGVFTFEHIRNGVVIHSWEEKNIVVDEGLEYILGNALDGATPSIGSWYVGLFSNNYTPVNTDTAATFPGDAGETTTAYSETTRPSWVEAGVSGNAIGNSASPAQFTFADASTDVYGAFLVSSSTKGGTAGVLIAASRFSSLRTMLDTDVLNVKYTITASSA